MNPRIKQTTRAQGPSAAELLAKMPRRPMSPEQQAAALEKVEEKATQRVKLGKQLMDAAEAKIKQHQHVLDEINTQQARLREQVQQDVAKSLQSYDQWMGKIDESFTKAINELGARINQLEMSLEVSRGDMENMLAHAAGLMEQTQSLLAQAFGGEAAAVSQSPEGEVAMEMIESPADPQVNLSDLPTPTIDQVQPDPSNAMPPDPTDMGEDIFGEVLRKLRSEGQGDGHAAA